MAKIAISSMLCFAVLAFAQDPQCTNGFTTDIANGWNRELALSLRRAMCSAGGCIGVSHQSRPGCFKKTAAPWGTLQLEGNVTGQTETTDSQECLDMTNQLIETCLDQNTLGAIDGKYRFTIKEVADSHPPDIDNTAQAVFIPPRPSRTTEVNDGVTAVCWDPWGGADPTNAITRVCTGAVTSIPSPAAGITTAPSAATTTSADFSVCTNVPDFSALTCDKDCCNPITCAEWCVLNCGGPPPIAACR